MKKTQQQYSPIFKYVYICNCDTYPYLHLVLDHQVVQRSLLVPDLPWVQVVREEDHHQALPLVQGILDHPKYEIDAKYKLSI